MIPLEIVRELFCLSLVTIGLSLIVGYVLGKPDKHFGHAKCTEDICHHTAIQNAQWLRKDNEWLRDEYKRIGKELWIIRKETGSKPGEDLEHRIASDQALATINKNAGDK